MANGKEENKRRTSRKIKMRRNPTKKKEECKEEMEKSLNKEELRAV